MTMHLVPSRWQKKPKHSADVRIAELKKAHAAELAELTEKYEQQAAGLRQENVALLNRQAAADDFFALLKNDVVTTNVGWREERTRRENAEKALVQAENAIRLRDRQITDLKRKVDVGVKAEHVIAQTQELDGEAIRRYCAKPMPLHEAPFATTNPGRGTPSWARNEPQPAA